LTLRLINAQGFLGKLISLEQLKALFVVFMF